MSVQSDNTDWGSGRRARPPALSFQASHSTMQRRPWHPWLLSRLSRVLVAVAVARAVTTAASSLDPASGTVRLGPLPGPCPPGSFSNCDKRCLRDEFVCDGKVDCALKQDETAPACPQTCKPGAFFCDGRCWADYRRCDGFKVSLTSTSALLCISGR